MAGSKSRSALTDAISLASCPDVGTRSASLKAVSEVLLLSRPALHLGNVRRIAARSHVTVVGKTTRAEGGMARATKASARSGSAAHSADAPARSGCTRPGIRCLHVQAATCIGRITRAAVLGCCLCGTVRGRRRSGPFALRVSFELGGGVVPSLAQVCSQDLPPSACSLSEL